MELEACSKTRRQGSMHDTVESFREQTRAKRSIGTRTK